MIRAKNNETVSKVVKVIPRIMWPFFPDTVYLCVLKSSCCYLFPKRVVDMDEETAFLRILNKTVQWKHK